MRKRTQRLATALRELVLYGPLKPEVRRKYLLLVYSFLWRYGGFVGAKSDETSVRVNASSIFIYKSLLFLFGPCRVLSSPWFVWMCIQDKRGLEDEKDKQNPNTDPNGQRVGIPVEPKLAEVRTR